MMTMGLSVSQAATINVYIDLDSWEGETTWTLTGPGGFSQSGGPYASADDIIDIDYTTTTLGTYTFTIIDSFGDGLSDNSGGDNENTTASYAITLDGSVVYASGNLPNFGSQDIRTFDITTDECDAAASGNTDTDGDNVSDICDLDDDNDGILDSNERWCEDPSVAKL